MSILAAVAAIQAVLLPLDSIGVYERADHDRTVTECDLLASHPDDPEAVAPGLRRPDMDLPAAVEACRAAVQADPGNPRLNYQLARAYGYSGMHEAGQPYRDAALAAGYPQSLFVVGYIRLIDWDGRGADPCYGGELIRRSAEAGRFAGLVGFPHYALSGMFEGCDAYPVIDEAEMLGFLDEADAATSDFYRSALITQLRARMTQ
jgi:hypothetical protein